MIHKQRRDKEKRDMAFMAKQPEIARMYRTRNIVKMTVAEKALWRILLSISGIRVVPQKPLKERRSSAKFYIADFYITEPHKIVIEADGEYHEDTIEYDKMRDSVISKRGIRVIRFDNKFILENPELVRAKIELAIAATPAFSRQSLG